MVTPSNTGGKPIWATFPHHFPVPHRYAGGSKVMKRDFLAAGYRWGLPIFDHIFVFPHGMLRPKNVSVELYNP